MTPIMSATEETLALASRASQRPSASAATPQQRTREPLRAWRYAGLALPFLFLAAIEVLVRTSVLPAHLVPAPSSIVETLWDLGGTRLARHVGASVARVFAGFALGSALALLIGATMGLSRRVDALLDPAFQALRAIPSLAWVPILLLWMGIDEAPKIALIAIGAFFPVQLGVVAGIQGVDRKLIEFGEVNRLTQRALFTRILLPASMPQIFTGLRTGLSLAWMFMVAAELIAATRGLGYLLSDGRETGRPDLVFGAILLLALLGKLSDGAFKALETRMLSWRDARHDSGDAQ